MKNGGTMRGRTRMRILLYGTIIRSGTRPKKKGLSADKRHNLAAMERKNLFVKIRVLKSFKCSGPHLPSWGQAKSQESGVQDKPMERSVIDFRYMKAKKRGETRHRKRTTFESIDGSDIVRLRMLYRYISRYCLQLPILAILPCRHLFAEDS